MTISTVKKKSGDGDMKSVTFTHTAAGTATGSATTTFSIHGRLYRIVTDDGGDAAWNVVLNDGIADIWTSPSLGTNAQTRLLGMEWDGSSPDADTDAALFGIPIAGPLTCSTSNMSGSGTGPAITIIYEELRRSY
jgi:hypothetical protein